MRVLITGAAGFLGTECVKLFNARGHQVITTDKTDSVDFRGDLADPAFAALLPDCDTVVNCAATHSEMGGEGVYSRSKMSAQAFVATMPGAATIIPCIIGGEGREGLFRGFVKMMKRFGFVAFPGRGDHKIHMVQVIDVAVLIYRVAETRANGFFNAAVPYPLSIREWIDVIAAELDVRDIRKISIPLPPVKLLSWMSGYRLLAREQLLMLKIQHVLSIDESLARGWQPRFSNGRIARDIAVHINRSTALQPTKK